MATILSEVQVQMHAWVSLLLQPLTDVPNPHIPQNSTLIPQMGLPLIRGLFLYYSILGFAGIVTAFMSRPIRSWKPNLVLSWCKWIRIGGPIFASTRRGYSSLFCPLWFSFRDAFPNILRRYIHRHLHNFHRAITYFLCGSISPINRVHERRKQDSWHRSIAPCGPEALCKVTAASDIGFP